MGRTLLAEEPASQSNSYDQNKECCKCPPNHLKGQPGALKSRVLDNLPGHTNLRKRAAAGSEPFPTAVLPGGAGDVFHSLIPEENF